MTGLEATQRLGKDGNVNRHAKKRLWWVLSIVTATVGLTGAWLIYDGWYRIPQGPSLPPQPAERTFSDEVVSLNDEAGECQLDDPEAALRLYDEALTIDPDYHLAHVNKARLLMLRKDYDAAAACFQRAVALQPHAAEYYVGHAYCLQRVGKTDEAHDQLLFALSAYNRRVEKSPFWAKLSRACVLFLLGRDSVAGKELDRLHGQYTDEASRQMVTGLHESFETAQDGDRWSVVGLP